MINISDKEFQYLSTFVKNNYGINLTEKKKSLVVGRLQNILLEHNFKNFSQYYEYILSDTSGEAVTGLINKITTNHTYFMRESEHFDFFKEKGTSLLGKFNTWRKGLENMECRLF